MACLFPVSLEQAAEADLLLQGSFHERRSHVVQIIFDLLGHMDGKPVEFIIKSLQDATEQLQDYKAENDAETDAAQRLAGDGSSLHDIIAAGLLGNDVAERAGLLPPLHCASQCMCLPLAATSCVAPSELH